MKEIIESKKCFGCSACYNICPKQAILMINDDKDFLVPTIDKDKCVDCGLCKKVCPALNDIKNNNHKLPISFAYKANNEVRVKSTSGGAFFVLASNFIKNGGYVAGAVWGIDFNVVHILSNKIEDIERMRKSKYLQSALGDTYRNIKQLLDEGKKVLFSGTPCQVSGLKSFLGKEYENLYSLDLICHGVPSPKVFKKYINEFVCNDEKLLHVDFRHKKDNNTYVQIKTDKKDNIEHYNGNSYMNVFLRNLCLRNTCTSCKFATLPRQGDLTIGDFWSIEKFNKKYKDELGINLLLVNNQKGNDLISNIDNKLLLEQVPFEYALRGNPVLSSPSVKNPQEKLFWRLFPKKSVAELSDICVKDKCDYLIVNLWDSAFNYGAMLTAFAMQEMVKSFGYIPKILNTGEKVQFEWYKNSHLETFANKYLDVTNILTFKKCKELSKYLRGAIIGSDQVLRVSLISGFLNKYLISFIPKEKQKIAFSPSFGFDKDEYCKNQKISKDEMSFLKKALKSFDYLSSRETQGVEVYKELFELNADMLLDPVFLIDSQKYVEIASFSEMNFKDKIFSYILREEKYRETYEYVSKKLNSEVIELNRYKNNTEDWLNGIINSKFVITDSFHCVCFSIIFNKPFVCIASSNGGISRLTSLFSLFKINGCLVKSIDDIYNYDFEKIISYDETNKLLKLERERCLSIVEKVLNGSYSNNPNKVPLDDSYKFLPLKYLSKLFKYYRYKHFGKSKKANKEKVKYRKIELEWNK